MRHPEKMVIKLTRMSIFLASPYEQKSMHFFLSVD
ncbi:hypothetical protein HAL1_09837 [Halomonas sp. HAL1]|nr:hypothetical protein HAL1_09837 [Halomonas sp. HAL1]